jgi:hypothetical protein
MLFLLSNEIKADRSATDDKTLNLRVDEVMTRKQKLKPPGPHIPAAHRPWRKFRLPTSPSHKKGHLYLVQKGTSLLCLDRRKIQLVFIIFFDNIKPSRQDARAMKYSEFRRYLKSLGAAFTRKGESLQGVAERQKQRFSKPWRQGNAQWA